MAARSVLKLITNTCSYTCSSAISSLHPQKTVRRLQRSCSTPREKYQKTAGEHFFQLRKISKSLENLRATRQREVDYEEQEEEHEDARVGRRNVFPPASDLTVRDLAKEFKEKEIPEEKNEEGNPIYELTEGEKSEENYYDVFDFMKRTEYEKVKRLFLHLQPNNLKPYGSTENSHYPDRYRTVPKIVYPTDTPPRQTETTGRKRVEEVQYKEFSSYRPEREHLGFEEPKRKNYSTSCTKSKSSEAGVQVRPKLTLGAAFTRKSSTILVKKASKEKKEDILADNQSGMIDQFYKRISEYKAKNRKSRENLVERARRDYNTHSGKSPICDDYVTVKLNELKEECRKQKKCKPKKISFGRLPKLQPPDCPCIEDIPLKQGKPLFRLKKRFEPKVEERVCPETKVCTTPRADANYKVKAKTLPIIHPKECPCEEREMTDLVIKRLPKKKIPEPPKICVTCVGEECCPPRADGKLVFEQKRLPKLKPMDCPCIEDIPLKDVPLKKLKGIEIKEPHRKICTVETCVTPRADQDLKVVPKVLPHIKNDCPCPEAPPMDEGEPISRLPKIKIIEKPRKPCEVPTCATAVRADKSLKVDKKKLPLFVPQNCPCFEADIPNLMVKLKRLVPKPVEVKKVICTTEKCDVRADDGMVVKPKQLPILHPKECPCVPVELVDTPPLKKLVPKPVEEPPKICKLLTECVIPRSDENLKVERKMLPVLTPSNCPCIEPPPLLDVKPLPKLKPKPVTFKRICPVAKVLCTERADEHLKVKIKKLPTLEIPDCPCIEAPPPEDIPPLQRLKRVHIPEPPKICKKIDDCDEMPRADADDWMYWKRVEVKPAECEEPVKKKKKKQKKGRRSYSTFTRRYYGTGASPEDVFRLRYDLPILPSCGISEQPYNIIIDIKPSAPLILTQKPIQVRKRDLNKKSRSEPSFVIYKSNNLAGKPVKEGSSDVSLVFNSFNRFISTCSTLYEYSERPKDKPLKDHVTPSCECPIDDKYLQPKNPIIPHREKFIHEYPEEEVIELATKKSRMYCRTRKDETETCLDDADSDCCAKREIKELKEAIDSAESDCSKELDELKKEAICSEAPITGCEEAKKLGLWEKIVNYFKARPDCPSPEEFRKMRLREEAERAASAAGLCVYDPKEMLHKVGKELPKVITAEEHYKK